MAGMTPVHFAAIEDDDQLQALLVGNRVQIRRLANACDAHGRTPLHWAVEHDRVPTIDILMRAGADINRRDQEGNTPLHTALFAGATRAARDLFERNARVVLRNNEGYAAQELIDNGWLIRKGGTES